MEPLALYVHWPYCSRICPYCDFNVTRDRNDRPGGQNGQRALFDAMLADMRRQAQGLGSRRLASVFFGGGTPSLLPPDWVAELIAAAKGLFPPQGEIEITLEANPTDAEIARYQGFRSAGVNRLSLGVQALDDEALRFLGRNHTAREAMNGIEAAQAVFGRVSLDLIYALPGQTPEGWEAELRRAAALGVEHISPYQLTIEHGTAFGRAVRRGSWTPPDPERAETLYTTTQATLSDLGFEAYEVSNHARGPAARSAHNVFIWEGIDYMGIGPGAHGRLTRGGAADVQASQNEDAAHGRLTRGGAADVQASQNEDAAHGRLTRGGAADAQASQNEDAAHGRLTSGVASDEQTREGVRYATVAEPDLKAYSAAADPIVSTALSPQEAEEEALMLGLRLIDGVRLSRIPNLNREKAETLIADGFLEHNPERLRATDKGRVVLDRLLLELLS